jgi:hypothetical protein
MLLWFALENVSKARLRAPDEQRKLDVRSIIVKSRKSVLTG